MSSSQQGVREELLAGDDAPAGTVVARGVPIKEVFEEIYEEVEDFPVMWRDRSCLMNSWLCTSILALVFCPLGFPGALLGFLGSCLYICRCCRPKQKFAGKKSTKAIFIVALLATVFDLAVGVVLTVLGVLYLALGCRDSAGEELTKELCSWRKLVAVLLLGSVVVLFLHFVISFVAFVSMRDCHLDLIRFECHSVRIEEEKQKKKKHRRHHHRRRPRPPTAPDADATASSSGV
ncbi:hypothetical protein BSKO_13622 [Bryopsis sp. KO-2023]|nr:hypothetical protein BSKO_13622 [Bryopsis sp. KO-2023]